MGVYLHLTHPQPSPPPFDNAQGRLEREGAKISGVVVGVPTESAGSATLEPAYECDLPLCKRGIEGDLTAAWQL